MPSANRISQFDTEGVYNTPITWPYGYHLSRLVSAYAKVTTQLINAFCFRFKDCTTFCLPKAEGSVVAWWLMPRTPDPEVGGSSPTRVKLCCVLEQGTFNPQKYW